jgi:hypothetical protein
MTLQESKKEDLSQTTLEVIRQSLYDQICQSIGCLEEICKRGLVLNPRLSDLYQHLRLSQDCLERSEGG